MLRFENDWPFVVCAGHADEASIIIIQPRRPNQIPRRSFNGDNGGGSIDSDEEQLSGHRGSRSRHRRVNIQDETGIVETREFLQILLP